ncbi:MAG TPA: hypothetical protein VKB59_16545 [Micromonosporaceae bacterium]|nr:hypothetical protein [Micromonosporaceae bacterium]
MTTSGAAIPAGWWLGRWSRSTAGRLMRLELHRSTMLLLLVPVALLLGFTELRNNLGQAPLWGARSIVVQRSMELVGGIVAGVAAWTAARDRRRQVTELLCTTARPAWVRQIAAWAAVAAWSLLLYGAYVAVVFIVTARQATWGSPNWWPAAVGATAVVACSAVGFVFGALVPGRFTAPLVTIGVLLAPQIGTLALQRNQQWGRLSPVEDPGTTGSGVFIPYHAGLSIVQLIFLFGVIVAALGALALPAAAGGRAVRRAGVVAVVMGLVAAAAGLALADSARQTSQGIVIPAFHSASDDRAIAYRPACESHLAVPICVHPAYLTLLPSVANALEPVLAEVAGLPGAPTRVTLTPTTANTLAGNIWVSGSPPVLYLSPGLFAVPPGATFANPVLQQIQQLRLPAADTVVANVIGQIRSDDGVTSEAIAVRQAVAAGIRKVAGLPAFPPDDTANQRSAPDQQAAPPSPAVGAAAQRFAALSPSVRHTWLVTYVAAIRAGQLTLADIP